MIGAKFDGEGNVQGPESDSFQLYHEGNFYGEADNFYETCHRPLNAVAICTCMGLFTRS